MRRPRNLKILATLGPATGSPESIRALFEAGTDVFRLNFSLGDHTDHAARFEAIRALEAESGRSIGILMNLQGPKFRIGTFEAGAVELDEGQRLRLDLEEQPGDATRAPLPHPEVFAAVAAGTDVLLDDG